MQWIQARISVRKIGWCNLLWQCRESFASFARPYLTLHHEQPQQSYRWLECFLGYSCQQNQCHPEDSRDWTQNFVVSYRCYVRINRFSVFFHFWRREWRWRQSISLPAIYLQSHSVFEERLLIIMECVTGSKRCAGTEMWTVILLLEGFIYNASQQDTTCHHQRNCWLVLRWAVSGVQV